MTPHTADIERHVRAYVGAVVPECSADRITQVRRLDAGENHDVYAVSCVAPDGESNVVVRIATSESARECARAAREAAILEKLRGVAAPLLYDFRCESQWFDVPTMCMQFVAGQQRPPASAEDCERFGQAMGWLHGLSIDDLGWSSPTSTTTGYLDTRVAKIEERLPFVGDPLPRPVQRRLQQDLSLMSETVERARAAGVFRPTDALALLHGDPAGGNIIWVPEPVLIDWEYARFGDPADEIAYIFNQNELDEPYRQDFWRGYQAGQDPEQSTHLVERVRWWEPVTVLGSAFFWVELWSRRAMADQSGIVDNAAPRQQDYYRDHSIKRLDRAEGLLEALG